MKRILLKGLLVITFAVVGVVASDQSASALGGVGYFTNNWTCSWTPSNPRNCATRTAYYQNDVVQGRPGVGRAVPNFGTNKFAYRDWVISQYNSGGDRRASARFIIATMLGSPSQADNIGEFSRRFDNPALRMEYKAMSDAQVNAIGSISYRGTNERGQLDFFWEYTRPGSGGNVYDFFVNGRRVYVLQQNCGNPVGLPNIPGIPPYNPDNWRLTPRANVRRYSPNPTAFNNSIAGRQQIDAQVGQTVEWELWIRNEGPTGMTAGASYVGERFGFGGATANWNNDWAKGDFPTVRDESGRSAAGGYVFGSWFSGNRFTRYTIRADDVGRTMCQRMSVFPRASADRSWLSSADACVYVPFNYRLTPHINVNPDKVESEMSDIEVETRIEHSGTRTQDTQWRIVKLLFNASDPEPSNARSSSNNDPCTHFAGATNCNANWWVSSPNPRVFTGGVTERINTTLGSDFNYDTRVCYATAVSRPTHNPADPAWSYSGLQCVTVVKKPKVQFWGSDVRAGNQIRTGMTIINSGGTESAYGSWAEYGMLARNIVQSASGGGLSSGAEGRSSVSSAAPGAYNRLTFANTPNFGNFGPVPATTLPPVLVTSSGAVSTSGTQSIANLVGPNPVSRWSTSGGLTISGGEVPAGKTIIINTPGVVRISGDITYASGPFNDASQLPQLIIMAGNIVINENVSQVNSWLIAKSGPGHISTCNDVSLPGWLNGVNGTTCNNRLSINGPVVANRIFLKRTFGSEAANLQEPAEVFNMRPDVYLWAQNFANNFNNIKTSYIRELPPRF